MTLVDSSVWIDYFRGKVAPETDKLDALLGHEALLSGDLIVAEVLQGFSAESEFNVARQLMTGHMNVVSLVGTDNAVQPIRQCGRGSDAAIRRSTRWCPISQPMSGCRS